MQVPLQPVSHHVNRDYFLYFESDQSIKMKFLAIFRYELLYRHFRSLYSLVEFKQHKFWFSSFIAIVSAQQSCWCERTGPGDIGAITDTSSCCTDGSTFGMFLFCSSSCTVANNIHHRWLHGMNFSRLC